MSSFDADFDSLLEACDNSLKRNPVAAQRASPTKTVVQTPEDSIDYYEQTVLVVNEVFVYKVPPLRTASGHRAEDWGLAAPLFAGYMRVLQADVKMRIVIYTYKDSSSLSSSEDNLTLFAECPIEVKPKDDILTFVDAVIDSSRYFVIRIKDPKSARTMSLGIGFRERETAFDFKNVLNEYVRYVDRMSLAAKRAAGSEEDSENTNNGEGSSDLVVPSLKDLSVKEGEKIKVNSKLLKPRAKKTSEGSDASSQSSQGKPFALLSKPPPAGSTIYSSTHVPSIQSPTSSLPSPSLSPPPSSSQSSSFSSLDNDIGSYTECVSVRDKDLLDLDYGVSSHSSNATSYGYSGMSSVPVSASQGIPAPLSAGSSESSTVSDDDWGDFNEA